MQLDRQIAREFLYPWPQFGLEERPGQDFGTEVYLTRIPAHHLQKRDDDSVATAIPPSDSYEHERLLTGLAHGHGPFRVGCAAADILEIRCFASDRRR